MATMVDTEPGRMAQPAESAAPAPARYSAFISYSHADHAVARWLHRALEAFRLPKALVGTQTPFGPAPRRLPPAFRDREELPASDDLGEELQRALSDSRYQIVICSPRAAASKWVNEEIRVFKSIHGEGRTLALIVDGEPHEGGALECFPPALRFHLTAQGTLSDNEAEPIAADIRPGMDGKHLALLKLIAGISGLRLDTLARRDAVRRHRQLMVLAGLSLLVAALTGGLAIYAESQRRFAERQQELADKNLQLFMSTFAVANPATENPRTITALAILDRASKRADTELRDQPEARARLLWTAGETYLNLGLYKEAERNLRGALAVAPPKGELRARILLSLTYISYQRSDARGIRTGLEAAARAYDDNAAYAPALNAIVAERNAQLLYLEGRYAEAAMGFGHAADLYRALSGDNRKDVGRCWMNQARAFLQLRQFDQADRLLAQAVATLSAKFGPNHIATAQAIHNQALADFEAGRLAQAQQHIAHAISIYGKVLDADHPSNAGALTLTGRIRIAQGDAAGALQAFDKARIIYSHIYGLRDASVADVDFYAAEAEARNDDLAGALELLANVKAIYDASYGPNDPDQVELLLQRARVLAIGGRLAEARQACAAGLGLQEKLDPRDPTLPHKRETCATLASVKS